MPARVRIPLPRDVRFQRLHVADLGPDVLLVSDVGDIEASVGLIISIDPVRMRLKWTLRFPSFNLSLGSIKKNRLYEAGMGPTEVVFREARDLHWSRAAGVIRASKADGRMRIE